MLDADGDALAAEPTLKLELDVEPGDFTIETEITFLGPSLYYVKEQLEKAESEGAAPDSPPTE